MSYDGAGDPRSRSGSPSGRSQTGSPAPGRQSPSGPVGYPPALGHDPAKPKKEEKISNRYELPAEAHAHFAHLNHTPFARRPGYSTSFGNATVCVNQFRVTSISDNSIYQFDVSLPTFYSSERELTCS